MMRHGGAGTGVLEGKVINRKRYEDIAIGCVDGWTGQRDRNGGWENHHHFGKLLNCSFIDENSSSFIEA
ncbi:MAG: hypothetical protein EON54_04955 [Alcaligenaceae bacterium]|nr:MAG: hypothetical protein EON54_04955 [Alcaligenaceae bacterium]